MAALALFLLFPPLLKADSQPVPRGTPGDLWADVVLGQPDSGIPNSGFGDVQPNEALTQSAFHVGGTVVDTAHGILYVWDSGNNRILGVSITGLASDPGLDQDVTPFMVLGQPDFFHSGCNHDSNWQNYPTPPAASATCLCGVSYGTQSLAEAGTKANMAVDSQGNLYVPDYWNNRVLRYDAQAGGAVTSLSPASHVWGQPDFMQWAGNDVGGNTSGSPSNQNLYLSPAVPLGGGDIYIPTGNNTFEAGVAVDSWGNLWVADALNYRVLRFPSSGGACCAAPAGTADVVLGQTGFTNNTNAYLAQPVAVRLDQAGNVYVVSYNVSLNNFYLYIYKPTKTGTGTSLPVYGTGAISAAAMTITTVIGADSSGVEWDAPGPNGIGGAPALGQSGGLWVGASQEIDLLKITLDNSDNISWSVVKTLMNDTPGDTAGSPSGDNNFIFYNVSGDGANSTVVRQPETGSPGVDANGNVYWISLLNNACNGVFRFPAPIPTPKSGVVHSADVEILKPFSEGLENYPGYRGMHFSTGVAVGSYQGVTQVVEAGDFLRFWNIPVGGPAGLQDGQRVNGLIGAPNPAQPLVYPINGYSYARADRVGHLWAVTNSSYSVWAYNLPLSGNENPFLKLDLTQPIPLLGGGSVSLINTPGFGAAISGMEVDPTGKYLWITDHTGNRVMRIRNPLTSPVVDIILGQTNATGSGCNGSGSLVGNYTSGYCTQAPTQSTLFAPGAVVLDHHGNLYISDHFLEDVGNNRLLRFNAASIQNTSTTTPLFGVSAAAVYGTNGSFTLPGCQEPGGVCAPWQPAFNHDDSVMVVGSDAQVGGSTPFQLVLANPLLGDTPVAHLMDYDPQSFSTDFDDSDNLYVVNHNRSRVLVYLQPFQTPTPTGTPTSTPNPSLPTATSTSTSTLTPSPTVTPTPTSSFTATLSPSLTATPSPSFTWNPSVPTFTPSATPNCCLTAWTITSGPLINADGLAYDPSGPGTLYAGGGASILGLNPSTGAVVNNSMPASFENVDALVMGGDGYLYVADYNGYVFKTQVPSGSIAATFSLPEAGVRSLSLGPGSSGPDLYVGIDSGNVYHLTQSGSSYTTSLLTFSPDANPVHQHAPGVLYVAGSPGSPATLYLSDCNICQRLIQYVQTSGNTYAYNNSYQTSNGNVYMGRITQDAFGDIYVGAQVEYMTFDPNFNLRWTCAISPAYGPSVAVDPAGGVYAGHQSQETIIKLQCSVPVLTATVTSTPTLTPTFPPAPSLSCAPAGAPLPVSQPWGLALDGSGDLYAVDASASSVDRFSAGGIPGTPLSLGQDALPVAVAVDSNGFIYVTDEQQDEVDVFNAAGAFQGRWGVPGSGTGQFEGPYGIAVTTGSGSATVFVADQGNQRVAEYLVSATGAFSATPLTAWGSPGLNGDGEFGMPAGIGLDGQGEVYVADQDTGIVQVFDGAGNWKRQWDVTQETPLLSADFVAAYSNCLVYVTDGFGDVGVFDPNGGTLGVVSGPGTGGVFTDTEGVAAGNGGWFVADGGEGQVDSFGPCPAASCRTIVSTSTPSMTPTLTPTLTPQSPTATFTVTDSMTATPSSTPSGTATSTASPTASATASITPTSTSTSSSSATASPSNTPTVTPTSTVTSSPTLVPTATQTPSPTPSPVSMTVVIGLPYPNPVEGQGSVNVLLEVPPGSTVALDVFTSAFRRIAWNTQAASGNTTLSWDLRDQWGSEVASGLYYLRITVTGDQAPVTRILKIVVLR